MYLKIRWQRFLLTANDSPGVIQNVETVVDEHIIILPVERVEIHGLPGESPRMDAWGADEYECYVSLVGTEDVPDAMTKPSRLLSAWIDGQERWLLVSNAWLLNERGDTIERVAP